MIHCYQSYQALSKLISYISSWYFQVILGGGRKAMLPITEQDPEHPHKVGLRMDGRNIIEEWLDNKEPHRAKYVWNSRQFDKIHPDETDHLIGKIKRQNTMHYQPVANIRPQNLNNPSTAFDNKVT